MTKVRIVGGEELQLKNSNFEIDKILGEAVVQLEEINSAGLFWPFIGLVCILRAFSVVRFPPVSVQFIFFALILPSICIVSTGNLRFCPKFAIFYRGIYILRLNHRPPAKLRMKFISCVWRFILSRARERERERLNTTWKKKMKQTEERKYFYFSVLF